MVVSGEWSRVIKVNPVNRVNLVTDLTDRIDLNDLNNGIALLNPPELELRHPRSADTWYVVYLPVGTGVSSARVGAAVPRHSSLALRARFRPLP